MAMTSDAVRTLILAGMPEAVVDVSDSTGSGDHFDAVVVSTAFAGKMPVERHRMVYAALGDAMRAAIHALALTTLTPEEKERRKP